MVGITQKTLSGDARIDQSEKKYYCRELSKFVGRALFIPYQPCSLKTSKSNLAKVKTPSILWLAYSGGVDSAVLLHLLQHDVKAINIRLIAIHINHQISAHANQWQELCQSVCQHYSVTLHAHPVKVTAKPRKSLEMCAREFRQGIFAKELSQAGILATAHHANDQIETFFINALRGGGLGAMKAMLPLSKHQHYYQWRPLLSVTKQRILDYAQHHHLRWVEDESNTDHRFIRNKIRHKVIPQLIDNEDDLFKGLMKMIDQSALEWQAYRQLNDWFWQRQRLTVEATKHPLANDAYDLHEWCTRPATLQQQLIKYLLASLNIHLLKTHWQEIHRQWLIMASSSWEHVLHDQSGKKWLFHKAKNTLLIYNIETCLQKINQPPEK